MKARTIIYALLTLIGLTAFGYDWFRRDISPLSFLRIQNGMDAKDVTAFFGEENQPLRFGTPLLIQTRAAWNIVAA